MLADFMFTSLATLNGISLAVKNKGLTSQQQKLFDKLLSGEPADPDDEDEFGMVSPLRN